MLLHSFKAARVLCLLLLSSAALGAGLEQVPPEAVGFDADRLKQIEPLIAEAIANQRMPGCVVCFGRQGKIAWLKAYGNRQLVPETVPMTTDTLFDMASITKPVATGTSIMQLLEQGKLRLHQKVSEIIPGFEVNGKESITVYDLLTHRSGLIPDNSIRDYQDGRAESLMKIYALGLRAPTGSRFMYSDVNFILLGDLVERLSGQSQNDYVREHIFAPLGMDETGYLPADSLRPRAAPTEQRNGDWMRGEVHDPRAYLMDGVAGHAGLFSTAEDLAIYAQTMLDGGSRGETRILSPETVALMTRAYPVPGGYRGLSWDKKTGYSTNKGDLLSDSAFGHGGFTGTVLWIDPEQDLFFIFLSNRVHPNGKGLVNPLAGQLLNVIAAAITDEDKNQVSALPSAGALTGIDVLQRDGFRQLDGRKVGLITNHTGRNRQGVSTVQLLHEAPNVELVALFSPEHGFEGKLDISKVGDSQNAETGLKIFSLYGETRRPTPEMLEHVDTVVFDIQDVGVRFYTYTSTMGEAMLAAAELGKRFVVLDRPNPINGIDVSGPMLDQGRESFVGWHNIAARHGMTHGELARMFKAERNLDLDLEVIACEGWLRSDYWDATGLTWINPSPNMRSLAEALFYPGIGMLETTNVSVGRGTDTPFEVVGAPWIDGQQLAAALNARQVPGVTFIPIEFTPDSSKFQDETCQGINIAITNRARFDSLRTGFEVAAQLRSLYPEDWQMRNYLRLMGSERTLQTLRDGGSADDLMETSRRGLRDFLVRRAEYLMYE